MLQHLRFIAQRHHRTDHLRNIGRHERGNGDGIAAHHRLVGAEFKHPAGIDRPDLGVNRRSPLQGAGGAGVGGAEPLAFAHRVDAVLRRVVLVLDQHAVADLSRHAVDGLQAMQQDAGRGRQAHGLAFAGQKSNGGSCGSGHQACSIKKAPQSEA
ncbi:MAG: hypothetical protein EOR92_28260 [Mesorhizobium sp.]|nr:MAG: hypothetical protein EOR02_21955 [Mesorhizobium sp.]RWP62905.1 MAG: hypothetical protein EOR07_19865 [Mesorhizobium sp.]RWQ13921.1 MAG: hypothetical protein EOR92_28260 [Mesorhizobium sp.]